MKKQYIVLFLIFGSIVNNLCGQEYKLPLYPLGIPFSKPSKSEEKVEKKEVVLISNVQKPDITVYLPSKKIATGQAVVICPGGGYWVLAYDLEGTDIARYFNSIGVAAIILKYRLPTSDNLITPYKVPLADAQRALRLVRYNAANWNIDSHKIGIMGFSAGGHLASTAGTHFDYGDSTNLDPIEKISCRPDFMILMYPVISFRDQSAHQGSREALLGKNADQKLVDYFSNELQVTTATPPTFIVHATHDEAVPVRNSLLMYQALIEKGVPAEMHILSEGGHGFGLGGSNQHISTWTLSLAEWLKYINKK